MAEEYAKLTWYENEEEYKKFIENLAPIVLFTYNRLEHTKKTIEALQQNVFAKDSRLFIYSDAPKNETAVEVVQQVRDYLHTVNGFKEITIIERDRNWGLAENIIDGVTKIVNEYGKIIVLEDDIVTSKYFLQYMNDALEIYKDEPKVMEISGNCWAPKRSVAPETFFLPWGACWGWGTWKRAWMSYERNPAELINHYNLKNEKRFNINGSNNIWIQVEQNYNGDLYTWAVFWDVAIYKKRGLVLFSREDMSINIGFDGTGENCGIDDTQSKHELAKVPVSFFTKKFVSNEFVERLVEEYNRGKASSLLLRVWKSLQYRGIKGTLVQVKDKLFTYL